MKQTILMQAYPREQARVIRPKSLTDRFRVDDITARFSPKVYEELWLTRKKRGRVQHIINCPEAIRCILVSESNKFSRSNITKALIRPLGRSSILRADDGEAQKQRRLLIHAFRLQLQREYTKIAASRAEELCSQWGHNEIVNITAATSQLTVNILVEALFGPGHQSLAKTAGTILQRYLKQTRPSDIGIGLFPQLASMVPVLRWRRQVDTLRRAIRDALTIWNRHRNISGTPQLLDQLFIASSDMGKRAQGKWIEEQIISLLLAGHDTTATTLTWLIWLTSWNPDCLYDIENELLSADECLGETLSSTKWSKTRAAMYETLRLYPPVYSLARRCKTTTLVNGRKIAKGDDVLIFPWILHRHQKFWEMPEEFLPSRFEGNKFENLEGIYIPFGMGPRSCPASSLAIYEILTIFTTFLRKSRFVAVGEKTPEKQTAISLTPKMPIQMIIKLRSIRGIKYAE